MRITVRDDTSAMELILEGRLAGPWVAELARTWGETASRLGTRKLSLNLCDVTYSDAEGKQVLRTIVAQTHADIVASTPITKYPAQEISDINTNRTKAEADHGIDA